MLRSGRKWCRNMVKPQVEPQEEIQGPMVTRTMDQLHDRLLPGIPNDMMLLEIAARLPMSAWKAAAAVSRDWERAFHGGMVCNARAVFQRKETFVIVSCNFRARIHYHRIDRRTLSLFSPNEERWYNLPSIPGFPTEIPVNRHCQHAFVDSSMYLLGGTRSGRDIPSAEVFVLDLAVHPLEWRRCANMQIPRRKFHVGIMHGKIFVFGGEYHSDVFELSNEAYDPKVDAWSWIAPLIPSVSADKVYSVGRVYSVGERFVCRGWMPYNFSSGWVDATQSGMRDDPIYDYGGIKLVVRAGVRGQMLTMTTSKDNQMDYLQKVIESLFFENDGRLPLSPPGSTPAEHLASDIETHEQQRLVPYLFAYHPVEDKWTDFQRGSLGANDVEWALPKNADFIGLQVDHRDQSARRPVEWALRKNSDFIELQVDHRDQSALRPDPVWTRVWTMRF